MTTPQPTPYPTTPTTLARPVPTPDERTWGMLSHLLTFVSAWLALGVIWPLIVLLTRGRDSAFVRDQAAESVNFQLTMLVALAASAALIPVLVGLVLLPAVGVWYVVQVIRASLAANRGEWFRYPLIFRIAA